MKKLFINTLLVAFCVFALSGDSRTRAEEERTRFAAALTGYQETPLTLASPASGEFTATLSEDRQSVSFELSYSGFETDVLVAHIHLGAPATTGGVTVFFCGGGGRPACPSPSGTVTGTFTAENVLAIPSQGLAARDLPKLLEAIGAGATYANVHSKAHLGGEIRGQIKVLDDDDHGRRERSALDGQRAPGRAGS
jgi:hypothetical protein